MGCLSAYLENAMLNHILGSTTYTPSSHIYIALSTTTPNEDGSNVTEPTGGGYARISEDNWVNFMDRKIHNQDVIEFNTATNEWGVITHVVGYDSATGGNMLFWGALTTLKHVGVGDTVRFETGAINVSIPSGGMSNYLANATLKHVFKVASYTKPSSLYLGLAKTNISDSVIAPYEPSGAGYARASAGGFTVSNGVATNNSDITFVTASEAWGSIMAVFIADDEDGGNVLFYKNLTAFSVATGDVVKISSSNLTITLD